jgi:PKD domain
MRMETMRNSSPRLRPAATALAVLLALSGCGLDEIPVPEMDGPSELANSIRMTASPDVITADGFSTSVIQAQFFGPNGENIAGRDIFFNITDGEGRSADIGELRTSNGPGTGATVRTNAQGVAQVVYEAPARTDATANMTVLVNARPVGNDFNGQVYRTVRIELRAAESRLFPVVPGGTDLPICGFTVQTTGGFCSGDSPNVTCTIRVGQPVLFQSTAAPTAPGATIIRYFWSFGNGRTADHADVSTVYNTAGFYRVRHLVTDSFGAQAACQADFNVQ